MLTADSRVRDVWANPFGRDVLAKVLLQLGVSTRVLALVGRVRLRSLPRLTGGRLDGAFIDALVTMLNREQEWPREDSDGLVRTWWKEAIFYQVYPRSFQDSNGDGIGDLRGIISRLDYLQALGVDALWLSPVYDSPMDDNGYDIRDYRAILAEFGTMADFDDLLAELKRRGMRLVMDLVVNHTSDEHPWFVEAMSDPSSPRRDWYFFRAGRRAEDGAPLPPNNWTSFFSGPAWRYLPQTDEWAMHLFSSKQMDLNWENPDLRDEIVRMVRWWLDKGVDGFRMDVVNYISKPSALPDGSRGIGELMGFTGIEHYVLGPRLHEHLAELRARAFDPYGAVSIGETPGIGREVGRLLTGDYRGELDMIFNFDHLENPGKVRFDEYRYSLDYLRDYYSDYLTGYGDRYWMSLFLENHDNPRFVSKVDPDPAMRAPVAKLLGVIQFTLRGTPFIYQGQELGLTNHAFRDMSALRDVESINKFAELLPSLGAERAFAKVLAGSRDHSRVPMPWDRSPHAGFTTGTPWIVGDGHDVGLCVAAQDEDPQSVLALYRELARLRRSSEALVYGEFRVVSRSRRHYWEYERSLDGETWTVQANLSRRPLRRVPEPLGEVMLATSGSTSGSILAPYEARVFRRRADRHGAS